MQPHEDLSLANRPFRGLIQMGCSIVVVLLITSICWGIWAAIAHRRLQAQIDAIVALHQPFRVDEVHSTPVPDDQNAAVLWKAAFAALAAKDTSPGLSGKTYADSAPLPATWFALEKQSISLNSNAVALASRAAKATEFDWGDKQFDPPTRFPFSEAHHMAIVLSDQLLYAHSVGDDSMSLEIASLMVKEAKAIDSSQVGLAQMVGTNIQALATARLMAIVPEIKIDSPADSHSASQAQVRELISALLDETGESEDWCQALEFERFRMEFFLQQKRDHLWALRAMADRSEARSLEDLSVDRLVLAAPSAVRAEEIMYSNYNGIAHRSRLAIMLGLKEGLRRSDVNDSLSSDVFEGGVGNWRYEYERRWNCVAGKRMAAIALAMKLYQIDHAGQRPASLTDIVPAYLKWV
jgi:hypothetical protein